MAWLTTPHPASADPVEDDEAYRRALMLGGVAADGPIGVFRVLRMAGAGDMDAQSIAVSALVRALPGVGALDAHDVLVRTQITESRTVGDLNPPERATLRRLILRVQPLHQTNR